MGRIGQDKGKLYRKEMHPGALFLLAAVYGAASFSVVLLLGIVGYVFFRGFRELSVRFFTSVTSSLEGTVGIAGNMVNTLYMVILTLAAAIPAGVGAAVFLNEYAGACRPARAISFAVNILAGIPSVIFGLFGMVLFGNVMGLGYSLLTGALTLSLMILPLIVENTLAALQAVPEGYRQGALGMGAGKWELIRTILLPTAKSGILSGIILAVGRIVGESAALLFTAGSSRLLPRLGRGFWGNAAELGDKILEPGGTLTVELYLQMQNGEYGAAFGIGCVLILLTFLMNLLLKLISRTEDGKDEVSYGK